MKLDLDDLERKARAAGAETPGWWRRGSFETYNVFVQYDDGMAPELGRVLLKMNPHFPNADTADHIAANSPPVTLALIARIRELEQMAAAGAFKAIRLYTDELGDLRKRVGELEAKRVDLLGRLSCFEGSGAPRRHCVDRHHENCPLHGLSSDDLEHVARGGLL